VSILKYFLIIVSLFILLTQSQADDSIGTQLKNLTKLYEDGVLDKIQFERAKKRLLNIENNSTAKSTERTDERTEKLKKLLKNGFITEAEFQKLLNTNTKHTSEIKVRQISGNTGREKFEKYEFYIDNFRVHTLNPGTIRIDNMLTGETDVVLSSNFKFKITKHAQNFFRFDYDSENLKGDLFYKGRKIINWTGRYVSRYQATFHQCKLMEFNHSIIL